MVQGIQEIGGTDSEPVTVRAFDRRNRRMCGRETGKNFEERVQYFMGLRGMDRNDAIAAALFGDPDAPRRPMSVEGIGFYTDKAPEYRIRKFLEYHMGSLPDQEAVREILAEPAPVQESFEASAYRNKEGNGISHWGCAAADIIYHETDIRLDLWEDRAGDYPYKNHPCLVFTECFPWEMNETERGLGKQSLEQILDRYARELGCEVESCYFIMDVEA